MRSMRMLVEAVFKASVSRRKKEGTKEREGQKPRIGHVTPSFLTDDEKEFQSVSLV